MIATSALAITALTIAATADTRDDDAERGIGAGDDVVILAYNGLGMHCMNDDFADMLVLPPFNTMRAQVIRILDRFASSGLVATERGRVRLLDPERVASIAASEPDRGQSGRTFSPRCDVVTLIRSGIPIP